MEQATLERANELIKKIEKIRESLEQAELAKQETLNSKYYCHLTQFSDGSGWKINLSGIVDSMEIVELVEEMILEKLQELEEEFKNL